MTEQGFLFHPNREELAAVQRQRDERALDLVYLAAGSTPCELAVRSAELHGADALDARTLYVRLPLVDGASPGEKRRCRVCGGVCVTWGPR